MLRASQLLSKAYVHRCEIWRNGSLVVTVPCHLSTSRQCVVMEKPEAELHDMLRIDRDGTIDTMEMYRVMDKRQESVAVTYFVEKLTDDHPEFRHSAAAIVEAFDRMNSRLTAALQAIGANPEEIPLERLTPYPTAHSGYMMSMTELDLRLLRFALNRARLSLV